MRLTVVEMPVDVINYQLRPSKNIERKLFMEMFRRLDEPLNIRDYRYIGLGGMWFTDFTLIHRLFGLTDLVSIEKRQAKRAFFNRPFECVQVEEGESSLVLPNLDLDRCPAIIWLDYDSDLRGPALSDIGFVTRTAASRSICLVTVKADVRLVRAQTGPDGQEFSDSDALRYHVGDLAPVSLGNGGIKRSAFPALVGETLLNAFSHGVTIAGAGMTFQPLLNIAYEDGATMVTVGGVLLGSGSAPIGFEEHGPLPFWPPSATEPFWIQVPHLTMREKAALDQMMPGDEAPSVEAVRERLGFGLSRKKLVAYHRFYREYPTFAEYEL